MREVDVGCVEKQTGNIDGDEHHVHRKARYPPLQEVLLRRHEQLGLSVLRGQRQFAVRTPCRYKMHPTTTKRT